MKRNLFFILFAALFFFPFAKGFAQETIMNDIDYPFMQKLINEAKQNYAEVKVKQEQVNIALTTYKQSKLAWFDALSFSYVYSPANAINLTSNNSVGSGVVTGNSVNPNIFAGYQAAVTLNIGNLIRNPFNTKNAKANYNISVLEQQAYDATLEAQVRRLYIVYVQQMAALRMRTQNAQDAGTMFTQAKRQFEKNTITVDAYSSSVTALAGANQAKIDAEAAVLLAKIALEEIVGKKLEEVK